jgi:hypothetical protein
MFPPNKFVHSSQNKHSFRFYSGYGYYGPAHWGLNTSYMKIDYIMGIINIKRFGDFYRNCNDDTSNSWTVTEPPVTLWWFQPVNSQILKYKIRWKPKHVLGFFYFTFISLPEHFYSNLELSIDMGGRETMYHPPQVLRPVLGSLWVLVFIGALQKALSSMLKPESVWLTPY